MFQRIFRNGDLTDTGIVIAAAIAILMAVALS